MTERHSGYELPALVVPVPAADLSRTDAFHGDIRQEDDDHRPERGDIGEGPFDDGDEFAQGIAFVPSLRAWIFVAVWPAICVLSIAILWLATLNRIDQAREEAVSHASEQAQASAIAYEGFLERSLANSDQLLEIIRYRANDARLSLEGLKQQGAFPGQDWVGAALFDAHGECLSASFGCAPGQNFAFREYFRFHRDHSEDVPHLGGAVAGMNGGVVHPTVIHLSRRLNDSHGGFAGVAMIALLEPYFTEFFAGSAATDPDIVALVGADGITRALRANETIINTSAASLAGPGQLEGDSGTTVFEDGIWNAAPGASLLAWKRLERFPMYAVVGFSRQKVLAPWVASRDSVLGNALVWSFALLLLGFGSALMASRVVSRHVREERVRAAYRVATEGTRDGLSFLEPVYDRDRRIVDLVVIDCNEAAASMLGMTGAELVGRHCAELLEAPLLEESAALFERVARLGHLEVVLSRCAVGPLVEGVLWVEHRIVRTGLGFAVTLRNVTEVVVHREQLEQMANEDRLTSLPNRNWLENQVRALIDSDSKSDCRFALFFVDFDAFKRVNDSMGHSTGDDLLRAAAQRLKRLLDREDSVVRLGGDEFVVLVRSVADESALEELADRIVSSFRTPFQLPPGEIKIGVSIGICVYPQHGESMEELLRNADIAMYEEKTRRRGSYSFFRPELFSAVKRKFEMEAAILSAMERNEFVLHFQPQFAIESGLLVGFEALVRWVRPGRGLILPADFIPVAEEAGLITRLGEQVIEKACQQLATWRALELPMVPVSVNVSALQFHQSDIRATFENALGRYRVPPELIQMEITESSMMGNEVDIGERLQQIRQLGVKISVDDFGTGYSSLAQLQQLRVDAIKIDRCFISKMQDSDEGEIFVRAIISMAHALAMKVVAEGVETSTQLGSLRRLRCEAAQGYLFSRPLAGTIATDLLVKLSRTQDVGSAAWLQEAPAAPLAAAQG
ncbi:MAG: EAL domain-containing protein [Burkholderiaceae bacterium]